MDTELQMAEARAYIARVQSGEAPLHRLEAEAGAAAAAAAPPVDEPIADDAGIIGRGQRLALIPTDDGLELRSAEGVLYGRLDHAGGGDRFARTAHEHRLLAFERTRKSWTIVARAEDDTPVAAFHRGWRPGGDVWVAPDAWSTLRWSLLARGASWRLESGGEEILRLHPSAMDRLEVVVHAARQHPALLILLVCQVVLTDSLPLDTRIVRDGADIAWGLDALG